MTTIYDALIELVGAPPSGLEPLIYCISCVILLFLVMSAFSLIGAIVKWIGGR